METRDEGKLPRLALASLLGAAALLCFLFFNLKGIWTDEGYRMLAMAGGRTWGEQVGAADFAGYQDVLMSVGPSAYQPFYFLRGNTIFTAFREAAPVHLKLLNIILLFVSIAGLLRLFRSWSPAPKLFLAALFTFNGYFMLNIFQLREYPLYLVTVIWATGYFFELYDGFDTLPADRFRQLWAAYVLVGVVGYYTHSFFLLLLGTQAVFVFWRSNQTKRFAVRIYAAFGAIVLSAIPWLIFQRVHFPGWTDNGNFSRGKPKTLAVLLETLLAGYRNILNYHDSFTAALDHPAIVRIFLDAYAILVVAAILIALRKIVQKPRELEPRVLFCLLTVAVFTGFQCAYFVWKDGLSVWTRYFIGNYFGVMVLAAFAFKQLTEYLPSRSPHFRRVAFSTVIGVTFLASALQLFNYYRYPFVDTAIRPTRGWTEIGKKLSEHVRPSDAVIYYHPLQGWTLSQDFRTPVVETNYWTVSAGKVPSADVIWLLDTHVDVKVRDSALAVLEKNGYRKSPAVKLGYFADLIRFDRGAAN